MREWFRFKSQADDASVVDIQIVDFIGDWIDDYWGFGVTAKAFIEQLSKLPEAVKTIRVHVNSPGGDVFSALNIANALRDQRATKGRAVETIVEGLAASAASVVIMAGDPVQISDNGIVMIHNPWSVAVGDRTEMAKVSEVLDKLRDAIVATYAWHSQLKPEEIVALMDAETWMDADEAIAKGFATEKVEGLKAAAALDPKGPAGKLKVPEKFAERVKALLQPEAPAAPPTPGADVGAPIDAAAVIRMCKAAGVEDFALALLEPAAPLATAEAQARIDAEKARRAAATARAVEIRALCVKAKQPDLADGYVAGGMSVEQVRNQLTLITAKLDKVEIDGSLSPDQGTKKRPVIDVMAVYAELNQLPKAKE